MPSLRARHRPGQGVPAAEAPVDPDQRQLVESERGLTYSPTVPRGSRVVEGEWWPPDYRGTPLVCSTAGSPRGCICSSATRSPSTSPGARSPARLPILRQIDWTSLGINFFTRLLAGALDAAPQTRIATVRVDDVAHEEALVEGGRRPVSQHLDDPGARRVGAGARPAGRPVGAGAATAAISILAGVLVLSGAVAAGQQRRVYDSVVLKVLGATRPMLMRGSSSSMARSAPSRTACHRAGLARIWLVVVEVMKADWSFAWGRVALTVLGGDRPDAARGARRHLARARRPRRDPSPPRLNCCHIGRVPRVTRFPSLNQAPYIQYHVRPSL